MTLYIVAAHGFGYFSQKEIQELRPDRGVILPNVRASLRVGATSLWAVIGSPACTAPSILAGNG